MAYDRHTEVPRPEFNYRLLSRLAEASGGEINPPAPNSLRRETMSKTYQPVRQPLLIAALLLLLVEITLRRLVFAESD